MTNYNESSTMNHTEAPEDELYQEITDICFENGGATKPMVDKLYTLFAAQSKQHQIELIEARCDELEDRLKIQFTKKHWEMLSGEVNSWAKYVDRRLSELKSQKAQLEGDI